MVGMDRHALIIWELIWQLYAQNLGNLIKPVSLGSKTISPNWRRKSILRWVKTRGDPATKKRLAPPPGLAPAFLGWNNPPHIGVSHSPGSSFTFILLSLSNQPISLKFFTIIKIFNCWYLLISPLLWQSWSWSIMKFYNPAPLPTCPQEWVRQEMWRLLC